MNNKRVNIYKTSRACAGLTQEEACYHLGISERALSNYETGAVRPQSDIVARMMEVYQDWCLGHKHLLGDPVGAVILPDVELCDSVAHCVVQCQKSLRELQALEGSMINVASDNMVDAREADDWKKILEKGRQMMAAVMAMMALSIKGKRPPGAGTPSSPSVNQQQEKYIMKQTFGQRGVTP